MKHVLKFAVALALISSSPALAYEKLLGTIVATTTDKNNTTTAAPFTIPQNTPIIIQCDVAAYYEWGSSSSVSTGTTTGTKIAADTAWPTSSGGAIYQGEWVYLSIEAVAGTATCKVLAVIS